MAYWLIFCLIALHSCVHLPTVEEGREDLEVESSFCRNNFFQDKWGKEKVPLCPSSEGLVLLPATFPPALVFLGYVPQPVHVQFLRELIEKLADDPQRPQLVITVPRRENEEAYRLFQKYLELPYSQFVRFIPMPSEDSLWTQDYFEVGVSTLSGKGTIVDLPSQGLESESVPSALALSCQMGLVHQESTSEKNKLFNQSDFGGNIEAFPGNMLVVGDHLSSSAQDLIELNLSQDMIRVNTSWGEPGHIDEVYSVLPSYTNKGKGGSCDFAIVYSSPELALKLLQKNGFDGKRERLSPPIPEGEESIPVVERVDFTECLGLIQNESYLHSKQKVRHLCEELIKANKIYAKLINQGLEQIVNSVSKRTGCNSISTIPVPVVYGPEKFSAIYGQRDDHAVNINPNPVNLISLGKTVVIAKQVYSPFENEVMSQIKGLGLDPYVIDGSYVHYLRGGIHCTSNVVRMCRPSNNENSSTLSQ